MSDKVMLSDVTLNITDGKHGDCINEDGSGYYFLSVKDIKPYKIDFENARQITKADFTETHKRTKLDDGDILLANSGHTIGKMFYVNNLPQVKNATFQKSVAIIKPDKNKIHGNYLYYNLLANVAGLKRAAVGSAQPNLLLRDLRSFEITVHKDLNQQIAIENTLSALDNKIKLNNKINGELEAMVKLIYDYWFVQYDFPDTNGKPYKSSGGNMVYNEELKREIPEGWAINCLTDWIESDKTGDWGKDAEQGNYTLQVDCIRGADINGLNGKGQVKSPNRFILQKNKHKLIMPYDLIIEISGGSPTQSTGRMAFLTKELLDRFDHPIICSNFCKAISLKNNSYFYNFVYQWNAIYDNGILFGWEGKTSGIKNLLFDSFINNHNVCVPPESLAKQFSKIIEPIQQKKQKSLKENSELEKLRDWLLPMLMNGQVTVK